VGGCGGMDNGDWTRKVATFPCGYLDKVGIGQSWRCEVKELLLILAV